MAAVSSAAANGFLEEAFQTTPNKTAAVGNRRTINADEKNREMPDTAHLLRAPEKAAAADTSAEGEEEKQTNIFSPSTKKGLQQFQEKTKAITQ